MARRGRVWSAVVLAMVAAAVLADAAGAVSRYALAGGCYTATGAGAAPVRLQATTLGRYLLYLPDRTYVTARADGTTEARPQPGPAADWRVDRAGRGRFTLTPQSGAPALTGVRFKRARGCAAFPEAELNARGRPARGTVPYGRVRGILEGHMHWMTFEYLGGNFHCGRPWHPYGIEQALPDCASIEGPQGTAAPFQNFLNYGNPSQPHDTRGYPELTETGASNLTYEGTYWRWIQRSWKAGLRLMVMGINENRVLCQLQPNRRTNCDEMDTVRRGFAAIRELQRYVDAQAGGPGKGFFRIVTNPYQARRVINRGKMAVVLEVEISEPFGCRNLEAPTCDRARVDRELDELHRLGVRSSLLLNKFDNPLTGVRFDSGPVGAVINAGNRESAGSFWSARTCEGELHDNPIQNGSPQLGALTASLGLGDGTVPAYPPAPHCNTRGLTDLGRHVVRRMMDLGMVVNPDHMSQAGVDETLRLLEARRYSGVISPHGWMDPGNWPRLWKLGGLAFPGHSTASSYVEDWRTYRPRRTPFAFGWGYGADLGGLSHQPDPDGSDGSIGYPFKSLDGKVTFQRERTGNRTFDYEQEGVAQYGLYADWFADLGRLGGRRLAGDMLDGAEAYLEMWERATGVRTRPCAAARGAVGARGLGRIRLGARWRQVLRRAGQPQQRSRAWSWCVRGAGRRGADVAVLDRRGRVALVGSTARGRSARGVRVGERRAAGAVVRTGRRAYVTVVRGGRVRAVAVAGPSLARRPAALKAAVRRLERARASNRRRVFRPSAAVAAGRLTGRALAGTQDARLNRALALLCSLQVQG